MSLNSAIVCPFARMLTLHLTSTIVPCKHLLIVQLMTLGCGRATTVRTMRNRCSNFHYAQLM